jgi:hypothetical protein
MEVWQPVPNFNGHYEISNLGQVKSTHSPNLAQRRLTEDQINLIWQLSKQGFSSRKICPHVGVSQAIVCKILRGAAYKPVERILKSALRRDGYRFVTLCVNKTNYHKTIHSMVAAAFIGPRPAGQQINHIDGDKQNNAAWNLEYVSRKGNMQHALYELKKSKKLTFDQAKDIWYAKQRGEKRKNIAAKHNVSIHMVTAIWMGKSWERAR